jgi:hypothetical protein
MPIGKARNLGLDLRILAPKSAIRRGNRMTIRPSSRFVPACRPKASGADGERSFARLGQINEQQSIIPKENVTSEPPPRADQTVVLNSLGLVPAILLGDACATIARHPLSAPRARAPRNIPATGACNLPRGTQ